MGGTNEKVQIKMSIESHSVVAGGEAIAMIHMHVSERISAKELVIRFSGVETYEKKTRTFTNQQNTVAIFENKKAEAGQFSYPVVLELPKGIPGTFEALGKSVAINYYLEAALLSKKSDSVIISDKEEITVFEEIDAERNSVKNTIEVPVKSCFCFSAGQLSLDYILDKFAYLPTEEASLLVKFNQKKLNNKVREIFYKLNRTIAIRPAHKIYNDSIHQENIRLIDTQEGLEIASINIPLYRYKERIERSGTTNGKHIQCRYTICVLISFGSCAKPYELEIPIMIYPREKERLLPASAPENWFPTEMPLSRLSCMAGLPLQPSAPELEDSFAP